MKEILFFFLVLLGCCMAACDEDSKEANEKAALLQNRKTDYIKKIPGKSDSISPEVAQKGEVLIAYSDCSTCHREDKRAKGPAFRDIAARYPVKDMYIKMLASRVINGGSGAWGYAVMSPHPHISNEDAETMVTYILSLDTLR